MSNILDYAPAAGHQLAATTIRTDADQLDDALVTVSANGRSVPVYWARPREGASLPVVLVLSEAFGLHAHIADVTRRFAKEGYLAIAPDLMVRQGDPMSFEDIGSLVKDLLLKIPDEQVLADLDACVSWASEQGGDVRRLAATGFCWGGRWTWLYAAHRTLSCAVAWYGIVDGKASGLFPDDPLRFPRHPIDVVGELKAPVLGLYGARDEAIGLDTVADMTEALRHGSDAAVASSVHVYEDAGHAFFADYRESYRPAAAQDAWRRCLAWIHGHTAVQG